VRDVALNLTAYRYLDQTWMEIRDDTRRFESRPAEKVCRKLAMADAQGDQEAAQEKQGELADGSTEGQKKAAENVGASPLPESDEATPTLEDSPPKSAEVGPTSEATPPKSAEATTTLEASPTETGESAALEASPTESAEVGPTPEESAAKSDDTTPTSEAPPPKMEEAAATFEATTLEPEEPAATIE
jgi:hypothetical protein